MVTYLLPKWLVLMLWGVTTSNESVIAVEQHVYSDVWTGKFWAVNSYSGSKVVWIECADKAKGRKEKRRKADEIREV